LYSFDILCRTLPTHFKEKELFDTQIRIIRTYLLNQSGNQTNFRNELRQSLKYTLHKYYEFDISTNPIEWVSDQTIKSNTFSLKCVGKVRQRISNEYNPWEPNHLRFNRSDAMDYGDFLCVFIEVECPGLVFKMSDDVMDDEKIMQLKIKSDQNMNELGMNLSRRVSTSTSKIDYSLRIEFLDKHRINFSGYRCKLQRTDLYNFIKISGTLRIPEIILLSKEHAEISLNSFKYTKYHTIRGFVLINPENSRVIKTGSLNAIRRITEDKKERKIERMKKESVHVVQDNVVQDKVQQHGEERSHHQEGNSEHKEKTENKEDHGETTKK